MRTMLITAFEPFGSSIRNTSAEVLHLLPAQIGGYTVQKMLLPVVFGRAAEKVLQAEADVIFLLGEAGGRNEVTPETTARNIRNARIPDNAGHQPMDTPILPGEAACVHTPFPVERIVARLREEGFRISVSGDAGSFVCNDTFFLVSVRSRCPTQFIHCPAIPERAEEFARTIERYILLALPAGAAMGRP